MYSIQSKYTNKSFTDAMGHLRTSVEQELSNAKKNGVKHLRIATNAELSVEQVRELEELLDARAESMRIWHRENLALRIVKQPFVNFYFFRNPQFPVFVPPGLYFDKFEKDLTDLSARDIPSFDLYLNDIKGFALSTNQNVLLVDAPGGYGKSHLLREIPATVRAADPARQVLVVRAELRSIQAGIQEELPSGNKYLLLLDDADRSIEAVMPLLALIRSCDLDAKLILSIRSAGYYLLDRKLTEARQKGLVKGITIARWKKEELVKLLRLVCGKEQVRDEDLIAHTYPSPYLVTWIGRNIKREPKLTFAAFKDKYVADVMDDSRKCIEEVLGGNISAFLSLLALIVPCNPERIEIINKMSAVLGIPDSAIETAVNRLTEAGVLRRIGRTIRFSPDMKGELFLSKQLSELSLHQIQTLVMDWIDLLPENVFANLGSASRHETGEQVKEILSDLVRQWINGEEQSSDYTKRQQLKWLSRIAPIIPRESADLVVIYLRESIAGKAALSSDDFGPVVLYGLQESDLASADLLEIHLLLSQVKVGTYGNYHVASLVRESMSPLHNSLECIAERLSILEQWSNRGQASRKEIIQEALCELLGSTHEYTRSYSNKVEFGTKALNNTSAVIAMRDQALNLVKKLLHSNIHEFQVVGLHIAEHLGRGRIGMGVANIPLEERFAVERASLLESVGELVMTARHELLSEIDDLLLKWWAQQTAGTEGTEGLLHSIPRSPEYLAYRFFASRKYFIMDFDSIAGAAPKLDRWSWFVDEVMSKRWVQGPETFKDLASRLSVHHPTKQEVILFLNDLHREISKDKKEMAQPLFLTSWVKITPGLFRSIRDDIVAWNSIPVDFRATIDSELTATNPEHIRTLMAEALGELPALRPDKYGVLLQHISLLGQTEQYDFLCMCIKGGSPQTRSLIAFYLYSVYRSTQDVELVLDVLIYLLSSGVLDTATVDNVSFVVHHLKAEFAQYVGKDDKCRQLLLGTLKDLPELTWHTDELLAYAAPDLDTMLNLIKYRLHKEKGNMTEFRAIPFEGIKSVSVMIRSKDDFATFLEKMVFTNDLSRMYLEHLVESVILKTDGQTHRPYVFDYIHQLLADGKVAEALRCADYIPLSEDTMDVMLAVMQTAEEKCFEKEAARLASSFAYPKGGYSSAVGEAPPELVGLRKLLESMAAKMPPGILKGYIERSAQSLTKAIQDHIAEGEETIEGR